MQHNTGSISHMHAGLNAHSSNTPVPSAGPGPPPDRPPSREQVGRPADDERPGAESVAHTASQRGGGSRERSPAREAADAASVDEVLKLFLQSNDKLANMSLGRWSTDAVGRNETDGVRPPKHACPHPLPHPLRPDVPPPGICPAA